MNRIFAALALALTLAAAAPRAQPGSASGLAAGFADVDRILATYMAQRHVPGAAWGVIVDGQVAHLSAKGLRDVEAAAPVDGDSVFRIASMTKSFTAMSILKLRDEGKLSLDDPAERYVPEMAGLTYPTTDAPKITIRHLLSHAEGFPEDNPWGDRQLADTDEQLSHMLRTGIPFSNAPGIAYEYSNLGFAILGRVVTNVSKMPYTEYVNAQILRPLGMTSTTLEPATVAANRLAHGYRWEDERWKDEPLLSNGSFGSMGGMLTSVRDLSRYVALFIAAWPPHDGPETARIKRWSLREMQHLWSPAPSSATRNAATGAIQLTSGGYGYGLRVGQNCAFKTIVSHTGGLPGFGSIMIWLPDYGVGLVAFGNLTYTGWTGAATSALEALVKKAGLQPRQPAPSPALTETRDKVSRLIAHWDDRLADSIAAENLFLDTSKDRRRAEIERLRAGGACTPGNGFDTVENALRGSWTMNCDKGKLDVSITLAPTLPPTVQFLSVRPAPATAPRVDTCPQ